MKNKINALDGQNTGTQLLIVDDELQIRKLLERYLSAAGYDCRTAGDVKAAKRELEQRPYDLVISDISMPGETGTDLLRYVKRRHPGIPVVLASVMNNPDEVREALELGVYGYIVKPFTRNIVLINVENALRRHQLEREQMVHMDRLETLVQQRTEALENQLTFLQTLIDAIPSPIFYKDRNGRFKGCNAAFQKLVGKKQEQIIDRTADDIIPDLVARISNETDRQLLGRPGKVTYEYELAHPDDNVHSFLINKATFLDAGGSIAGLAGVMIDITERKSAEEALRISEEKFRQIVESIGIGVAMIDKDMQILWMNGQMSSWFPHVDARDNPICHHAFNTPPRASVCTDCPTARALKEGRRCETTMSNPLAVAGYQFRIIASPIHDKDGNVVAAIELVEDISKAIALERDLRQAQKLEAIGQLAAGIAHEINTPTQYIGDNTRFIQDAADDLLGVLAAYDELSAAVKSGEPLQPRIDTVERLAASADLDYLRTEIPLAIEQTLEGVSRVSKIVTSMRQFSHPGTGKKTPVDINKAIEATITVARNEWKYVADLETDFETQLPMVNCLPGEINQVFLNLLINAAHAISEASDNGKADKGLIRITTRVNGDTVSIQVSDTGTGIPEPIQQRIFDPFFTTKAIGQGTGQGLAIAHDVVVEKHTGSLRFTTDHNRGTTFTIELPVGAGQAEESYDEA